MAESALSHYAIIMNYQQQQCRDQTICLHKFGTLAKMRGWAGRTCDGKLLEWPARDWTRADVEPIKMLDTNGYDLPGTIAKLSYVHADAASARVILP